MTTTTPAPSRRAAWPCPPSWATTSQYCGGGLDRISETITLPATEEHPAVQLRLVRLDRVELDDAGVTVRPGRTLAELGELDSLPLAQARRLLAERGEAALRALDALLGGVEASTCTRCGCTPDQLYPSHDGPLCAPCGVRQAKHGE